MSMHNSLENLPAPKFKMRLSRSGLGMLLMNLFILAVAIIYNNNLCYLMAFLVAGFNGVAFLKAVYNLRYLDLKAWQVDSNFVGLSALWEGELINRSGKTKFNLEVYFSGQTPVELWRLKGGQKQKSKRALPLTQRGSFTVPPVIVASKFPLGMLHVAVQWPQDLKYDAYPRLKGNPELTANFMLLPEGDQSGQGTGGDDFAGHRKYQEGESLRHVNWFLWAKRPDSLQVKVFAGGSKLEYLLRWADVQHLADDEAKLSQLALWMFTAQEKNISFRAELPNCVPSLEEGPKVDPQYYLHALAVWPQPV